MRAIPVTGSQRIQTSTAGIRLNVPIARRRPTPLPVRIVIPRHTVLVAAVRTAATVHTAEAEVPTVVAEADRTGIDSLRSR